MSPNFQIKFQTTRKDYLEWNNFRLKNALKNKIVLLVIISILASAFVNDGHFDWVKSLITLILFPMAMTLILYLLSNGILLYKLYRLTLGQDNYKDSRTLSITEEGLIGINTKIGNPNVFNWNRIASVYSTSNLVCIELSDKSTFVIPKRHFRSENNEKEFIEAIESHSLRPALQLNKAGLQVRSDPNYAMGWLCLIPLIGAAVGIAFIINGIFNYNRNVRLIFTGIFGILFSAAFYFVPFKKNCSDAVGGIVMDAITKKPIDSVHVYMGDNKNVYTDINGKFDIREVDSGVTTCPIFRLKLIKDRYKTKTMSIPKFYTGEIYLEKK